MTNSENTRPGSGFISVDNDDGTAENVWRARNAVGLHTGMLSWNIVPWYLGAASRKPTSQELEVGGRELLGLLPLLPQLSTVVLAGLHARNGWRKHVAPFVVGQYTVIETWHASPLSFNQPGKREHFLASFERAVRSTFDE